MWQISNFRAKQWIKDITKCCHWARTTNIGLLHPKVRNNVGGDIPIDIPTNQNIGGDVSPASPAALTPVRISYTRHCFSVRLRYCNVRHCIVVLCMSFSSRRKQHIIYLLSIFVIYNVIRRWRHRLRILLLYYKLWWIFDHFEHIFKKNLKCRVFVAYVGGH